MTFTSAQPIQERARHKSFCVRLVLLCLWFCLLFSPFAVAQGVWVQPSPITSTISIGAVRNVVIAVPNPTVRVCTASATGNPCSPLAPLCTDSTCASQTALNPFTGGCTTSPCAPSTSDAFGNAGFWILPGNYIFQISAQGVSATVYNLTAGGAGAGGGVQLNPVSDQTITSSGTQGLIFNNTNGSIHIWPNDPTFGVPLIRLNSKTTGDTAVTFAKNGVEDFALYHHGGGTVLAISETDLGGIDIISWITGITQVRSLSVGQPINSVSGQIQFFGATSGSCIDSITATSTVRSINCPVQTIAVAFSALPTCASGLEGSMRAVTDSTTNTWGATVTGGSNLHIEAYCDGTNWTVAAK